MDIYIDGYIFIIICLYITCPVQTVGRAGTNAGRAAGRDVFRRTCRCCRTRDTACPQTSDQ